MGKYDSMSKLQACMVNTICMMVYLLTALIALSVGLYFFFVIPGTPGYGVGIAMFIVAGVVFAMGELMYFVNMGKLKMNE